MLAYRCSTCRQSNITPSLQEALDDINKKFGEFINKFSQIEDRLENVEKVTSSVPALNKDVEYLKSDRFNESIISEAMHRIEKLKSIILYDLSENEDHNFDMNNLKQVFEKIPIDLSTMSCKRDGPKKDNKPRMIRITFQDPLKLSL